MSINKTVSYQTINTIQLHLNSANADIYLNSSHKSSVVFFFEDMLKIEKSAIETRVSVSKAQIPYTWYQINETNNQIVINGTLYYFPLGNYNVNNFISTWCSLFTNMTVTFSNITNKLTFSSNNNFTFSDNNNFSLLPTIGFMKNKLYSSALNNLTSPFVVNFLGLTRINIKSSSFNFRNLDSYEKGRSTTICAIPVNCNTGGLIQYANFTNSKSIFKNHEISSVNFDITDDQCNLINFNNIDWAVTIQVEITCEVIQDLDNLEDVYKNATQES